MKEKFYLIRVTIAMSSEVPMIARSWKEEINRKGIPSEDQHMTIHSLGSHRYSFRFYIKPDHIDKF